MNVVVVDTLEQMDLLQSNWESVYAADAHASIFLSWNWLRGFFEVTPFRWFVLALRPDDVLPFVAFLPLAIDISRFNLVKILRMGGVPAADYTGLVSLPAAESAAINHFARYIQQELAWDRFHVSDALDRRMDALLELFSGDEFYIHPSKRVVCPFMALPEGMAQYFQLLSRATRKSLKRNLRHIEALEDFRVTFATQDNFDNHIELFYRLWSARWGERPFWYRRIFQQCFVDQNLLIILLWDGDIPIAASAAYMDPQKKVYYDFASGYNSQYLDYSPGNVIFLHGIQYAIEQGYTCYDFLRGGEAYKYSLGAQDRYCVNTLITRKNFRSRVIDYGAGVVRELRKRFQ